MHFPRFGTERSEVRILSPRSGNKKVAGFLPQPFFIYSQVRSQNISEFSSLLGGSVTLRKNHSLSRTILSGAQIAFIFFFIGGRLPPRLGDSIRMQ
jgi:hypothetical protein